MTRIRLSALGTPITTKSFILQPQFFAKSLCTCGGSARQTRPQSTVAKLENIENSSISAHINELARKPRRGLEALPSPNPSRSLTSAKLAALHARLSLSSRLPLQTLARSLVDPTADSDSLFNNSSLSVLGSDLLGYWTSEHIICNYPRLPMSIVFAAQDAFVGPRALSTVAEEWGVEHTQHPGGEVDPGILQYRAVPPGETPPQIAIHQLENGEEIRWRRGINWRVVKDDEFGEISSAKGRLKKVESKTQNLAESVTTLEHARRNFVRAVIGALYLHTGAALSHSFFKSHFLSRHLSLHTLFDFPVPTRDLSRLCAREGFEPPVARLISETGRLSRHPVFVVGVFSGNDKLGEAAGGSLNEARIRAAASALRSWYLYSPIDVTVPSSTEHNNSSDFQWRPNMVDLGEVIH